MTVKYKYVSGSVSWYYITDFSAEDIVAQNPANVELIRALLGATMATPVPPVRVARNAA